MTVLKKWYAVKITYVFDETGPEYTQKSRVQSEDRLGIVKDAGLLIPKGAKVTSVMTRPMDTYNSKCPF